MNDLHEEKKVIQIKGARVEHNFDFPVTLQCETIVWTLCMTYWEDVNDLFIIEIPYIFTLPTLEEALKKLKNMQQKEIRLHEGWSVEFSFEKVKTANSETCRYEMFMQKKRNLLESGKTWLQKKRIGECFIIKNTVPF